MRFGVKSWLTYLRGIVVVCAIGLLLTQQLSAQISSRGGLKKDSTNLSERVDTLNTEMPDSVEVFELNYEEKYKSIRFTKSQHHFNYQNVDTLFDLAHQFDPINKSNYRYNNIGIIGSPVYDLFPNYTNRLNFDDGFNQFKPYQINADSIKIFKVNAPFTKFSWRFGTKEQQFFKVIHANRIKEILQFGVSINRISGEGFYANQRVRNSGFSAYTTYNTKNKKYKLLTTLATNAFVQEQNGGISEAYIGQIFDKDLNGVPITQPHRRNTVGINLQNTFGRSNSLNIAVNQYLNFGKYFNETTADSSLIKRFVPQVRLKHKIAFIKADNVFEGGFANYTFYPSELRYQQGVYLDSISTSKWYNQLAFIQTGETGTNSKATKLPFKSVLSLNYERITVKRLFADSLKINNTWLAFNLNSNLENSSFSYNIEAQYGFGINNYQASKYFVKASANYQLSKKSGTLTASYIANNYNAAFLFQNYDSNFYTWQNNFDATNINTANLNYQNTKYNLNLSASRINFKNLPYFLYDALAPAQINLADGNLYRLQIHKTFTFGWWKMKQQLTYQTVNNADLSLPNWVYNGSFYYSDSWFKKALSFNTGFDVRYTSNFYLPFYNPVIGQFYNQTNFEYALYPAIDFFINCKIQTAIIFFKVEYINQNWFQRGFYTAVNYPAPDYTFRGGVSWRFFD